MKKRILEIIDEQERLNNELRGLINSLKFKEKKNEINEMKVKLEEISEKKKELNEQPQVVNKIIENESMIKEETQKINEIKSTMPDAIKKPLKPKMENIFKIKKEIKLGLNIFNYIGVIFIFLGFISLAFLTGKYMSNGVKSFLMYIFSVAFLGAGHFYYKKNKVIFSKGLVGCGIGLLYISTYASFFILNVFNKEVALFISVLITIISILLTIYYKDMVIAILSQVGGYLPVFAFLYTEGFSDQSLLIAQLYVLLLNVFMFMLYKKFKWSHLNLISFILMSLWVLGSSIGSRGFGYFNYFYALLYFMLYTILPRFFKEKENVNKEKNAAIYIIASLVFSTVAFSFLKDYKSVSNIIIYVSQICIYKLLDIILMKVEKSDGEVNIFLEILSNIWLVLFAVIYLPFVHFDNPKYMLIALCLISVIYTVIYIKLTKKRYLILSLLFSACFYFSYFISVFWSLGFTFRAICLLLCLVNVLIMKKSKKDFKYLYKLLIIAIFFHTIYFLLFTVSYSTDKMNLSTIGRFEKVWLSVIVISIFSYISLYIKDFVKYKLPYIVFFFMIIFIMLFNVTVPTPKSENNTMRVILIIIANIVSNLLSLHGIVLLLKNKKKKEEIIILLSSFLLLVNGTVLAYNNISFSYLNILLDIVYGFISFGLIIIGFKKDLSIVRKTGLFMIITTIFKLMLIDIPTTSLFSKMIAFFVFGVLSFAISFMYQSFNNKKEKENKSDSGEL